MLTRALTALAVLVCASSPAEVRYFSESEVRDAAVRSAEVCGLPGGVDRGAYTTMMIEWAVAESLYPRGFRSEQVRGPARSPWKVEPSTLRSVVEQLNGPREMWLERWSGKRAILSKSDAELSELLAGDPLLGAVAVRIKLGNLSFGGRERWTAVTISSTLQTRARLWKRVWNTDLGAGTEDKYISRVESWRKSSESTPGSTHGDKE